MECNLRGGCSKLRSAKCRPDGLTPTEASDWCTPNCAGAAARKGSRDYTTLFCPNADVFEFPEGASISVGQDQTEDTRAHIRRLAEAADATIYEDREAHGPHLAYLQ